MCVCSSIVSGGDEIEFSGVDEEEFTRSGALVAELMIDAGPEEELFAGVQDAIGVSGLGDAELPGEAPAPLIGGRVQVPGRLLAGFQPDLRDPHIGRLRDQFKLLRLIRLIGHRCASFSMSRMSCIEEYTGVRAHSGRDGPSLFLRFDHFGVARWSVT